MANESLMAALAGGNENVAANPFLLEAAPDLQTAMQLQQAGMSTAPAVPAQAFGRLAQALAGTVMRHQATSDLAKAITGTSQKMAGLFPEGSIMRAGLSSTDPWVQMVTWQQLPKAMTLLSAPEKLGPTDVTRSIPAGAPANQPLAAGSPALAGATAGAQAAGKAPYEPGGPAVEQTPYGPREIEQTSAERADKAAERAARAAQRKSGTPTPSAAVPPPEAKSDSANPSALTQPPVGTVMGKPLETPTEFKPLIDKDSEEVSKTRSVAEKAQQTNGTAKLILDLLPRVQTGWTAETKLQGENILKGLGVDPAGIKAFDSIDLASGQVLSKKFLDLSMGAMRSDFGGGREAFGAMQMFRNAYPSIGTDPDAVRLQTNVLRMDNLRAQHLANAKTAYLQDSINNIQNTRKYRGLNGFNENFAKSNSAENYMRAAEAMSGPHFNPWDKVKSNADRNAIVNLIPPGEQFYAPDQNGKMQLYTKPGGAIAQ